MVTMILMALMFVVQVGMTYHARQVLAGAVQDGATSAAAKNSSAADGVGTTRRLIEGSAGGLFENLDIEGDQDDDLIVISASADVVSVVPNFFPKIVRTVQASASASRERFRGQNEG